LHKLDSLQRVGGTSAGAIIALCIALGYTSEEIEKIILQLRIQSFNDGKFFFIGGLHRLRKNMGYYKGEQFMDWVTKIIENKTGNGNITFAALQQSKFKELYVVGTSINRQQAIVFSHLTYPNMCVSDAVRISMSVPLYFEPIIIDSVGTVFKSLKQCVNGDMMVDGGLIDNFPIHIFDTTIIVDGLKKYEANANTVGLRIDGNNQVMADKLNHNLVVMPINKLSDYFTAFYTLELELASRNSLSINDWKRTISIPDMGYSPKVKKMNLVDKQKLINSGSKAVLDYYIQ
jgi:NTE family protein